MHARSTLATLAAAAALAVSISAQAGLLGSTLGPTLDPILSPPTADTNWTLGGVPCTLIPVPAAAPVGTGTCPGVRPGGIVVSDIGQCTLNFLFQGSDGNLYIGTAGHCILGQGPFGGDAGEMSWAPGTGPMARDGNGNRIGEFAYAILQDPKDFSLIRIDPQVPAEAGMCHFGGPTGVNADQPGATQPVVLNYFGNGVGVGVALPARSALAAGMPDPDHVFANGAVAPGDSGSGIMSSDGRAVGVVVTLGVHTGSIGLGGVDAGTIGITRLLPQAERAEAVLGVALTILGATLQ